MIWHKKKKGQFSVLSISDPCFIYTVCYVTLKAYNKGKQSDKKQDREKYYPGQGFDCCRNKIIHQHIETLIKIILFAHKSSVFSVYSKVSVVVSGSKIHK